MAGNQSLALHVAAVPVLRIFAFITGLGCQAVMAGQILGLL